MQYLDMKKCNNCSKYAGFIAAFNSEMEFSVTLLHSWACVSKVVMMQRLQAVFMEAWIYVSVFSRRN